MCSMFPDALQNLNYQEDPVSKGPTHSISRTNKHSFCINYHFQLLRKSDKSYQEDAHYCQALSDGKEFLVLHKLKTPQREQVIS